VVGTVGAEGTAVAPPQLEVECCCGIVDEVLAVTAAMEGSAGGGYIVLRSTPTELYPQLCVVPP